MFYGKINEENRKKHIATHCFTIALFSALYGTIVCNNYYGCLELRPFNHLMLLFSFCSILICLRDDLNIAIVTSTFMYNIIDAEYH